MFFKSWDQNWAYISMVWMIWYDCSKKKIEDVTFSWSKLVERRSIIFETLKAEVEGLWGFKGVLKNNGYCTHGGSKMFLFLTPSSIGGLLSLQYLCIVYTTWYKILYTYMYVQVPITSGTSLVMFPCDSPDIPWYPFCPKKSMVLIFIHIGVSKNGDISPISTPKCSSPISTPSFAHF